MTTLTLPPYLERDPSALIAALKEHGVRNLRTIKAIRDLRRTRRQLRASLPAPAKPAAERLPAVLTRRYTNEVLRRGGEIGIESGSKASDLRLLPLAITDRRDRLVVLHVEGWRYYSRAYGSRFAAISYLCGRDDNGDFAVRIPGTIETVTDALDWITPAAVKKATAAGKRVDRQGDLYAIATTKAHDAKTGWVDAADGQRHTSHHWNAATRELTHHPEDGRAHSTLVLDHPVRFLQQRTYAHGRGGVWGAGD
ncbi:hypothetical protein [Actinoplanes sp. URMC 104]|uniref:hypothetical protein n=1 Tax=Actinoplanes sp. URMC 104 TaxID=3423409 RepID=UPI003F1D35E0